MKIHPEKRSELMQGVRYQDLLRKFSAQAQGHVENVLIIHLPQMSEESFVVFVNFLQQQSEVKDGVTLHTEQVARLAAFLVKNRNGTKHLEIATAYLREKGRGIAASKGVDRKNGCSGYSQSFWHIMRKGRLPIS